ncbi:MAG: MFS transporter [Pirellulales bacterium]|nr:MFS transporter [Pirellulales bacterium]
MADLSGFSTVGPSQSPNQSGQPWYRLLTRYHWFVLVVAALGWLFDCLDQQLFVMARPAVMADFFPVPANATPAENAAIRQRQSDGGNISTSIFMAGWALGGIVFGVLGDRIGRARTMVITILMYSLFTGLSSFAVGLWDFAFYRFLTGLGVGGEFAVGVALVAEVMPAAARPYCLGLLQALSAVGNISAALINLGLGIADEGGLPASPWRIMFLIGAIPALLALVIRRNLQEPEVWQRQQALNASQPTPFFSQYQELFSTPKLRKHAILGLILGCAGIIGLWSVGFFTMDLIKSVARPVERQALYGQAVSAARASSDQSQLARLDQLIKLGAAERDTLDATTLSPELRAEYQTIARQLDKRLIALQSYTGIALNVGAFFGMFGFGALSQIIGRKPTFALAFIAAFISTVVVFLYLQDFWQIWVLVPIMGFCQLSLFAGYAIYFPELFPTRLRSTGTSFCYNVGRFIAASGPLVKLYLEWLFKDSTEPLRYAGATMCFVFIIGLLALPFLPETKGRPLPE